MKFNIEVGAIIAEDGGLINMFDGQPGHVDFPDAMIARIHQMRPGYIQRFTHTHPPGMGRPSGQDNSMMSNLAMVMHPFPVRLGIIVPAKGTLKESQSDYGAYYEFVEHVYQWVFEPREVWEANKMVQDDIERAIVYERIKSRIFTYRETDNSSWEHWLIERSYHVK